MSTDLAELHESARQVLSKVGLAAEADKTWPLILDLGWLLVALPESLGGLEQGLPAACAMHTELGRSLAAAPYLSAMLALDAVCHSDLADRETWVERITTKGGVAVGLAESTLHLTRATGCATLSGLAMAVPSADKATHMLVCTADGKDVALVALDQPGVVIIPRPTWDVTRKLFDLRFTDVALDAKLSLASGDAATHLIRRLATHLDFALAADSVGGAEALLQMTVEYLKTRRQFGRPLALFQALKHRCADLKALTAAAEALLSDSLARLGNATADAEAELKAKAAKSLACSVYFKVAEEALQLHGGIGMTSEHACHLFLKRALLNEQLGWRSDRYALDIAAALIGRL